MRCLRNTLIVLALLLFAGFAPAQSASQDATAARARAAAALRLASCTRGAKCCSKEAEAKAKAFLVLAERTRERTECLSDLTLATEKALAGEKVMFIWVGMTCERSIRAQFPEAVHVHIATMNNDPRPRLLVGRADQKNFWIFDKLDPVKTPAAIRDAMKRENSTSAAPALVVSENC